MDAYIEVDLSGRMMHYWSALEHGFNVKPDGNIREINHDDDHYRKNYPTLEQTTHINSAIYSDEFVFCSLFHQGKILKLDRSSGKILKSLGGLSNPHSIYDLEDKFVVSDTSNYRVLFFSKDLEIIDSVKINSEWIQDSILTSRGTLLVADSNNSKIVEYDLRGAYLSELNYSPEQRIYQIKEIF